MRKFITNICTLSLALTAFTQFGTVAAFAADLSAQEASVAASSKQDIIRNAFAKYTTTLENAQGAVKALSEASLTLKENNVSSDDLIQYALSDMKPAESKAFLTKVNSIRGKNLSVEEIASIMASSQGKGANFFGCAMGQNGAGFMTALLAGTAAFIMGVIAITDLTTNSKSEIQKIELTKVETQQEINILLQEGVSENSYLVTSRRADLAIMIEKQNQLRSNDKDTYKKGEVEGAVAAGALVLTLINLGC